MQHSLLAVLTALPLLAPLARADEPQHGFDLELLPYPGQAATATFADGRVVAFDGLSIDLFDANGALLSPLGTLPAFAFPSFVLVSPDESTVVLGESSNGWIFELGLTPGTPDPIGQLALNYDAVFEDDGHVIVSAAVSGFGSNEIHRVDLAARTTTLLARVSGASGPVALDAQGNLLYGTVSVQFPAPPASSAVLLWEAVLLTGAPVLDESDAQLVEGGFDGAADLAVDLRGAVYLAENNYGNGVNRIRLVAGNPLIESVLVDGSPFRTISNLEFAPAVGPAAFAPYQPPGGGILRYNTTDFGTVFERRDLIPSRPTPVVSGPGTAGAGPFDVVVTQGPPAGTGVILYGPASQYSAIETVYPLAVPLFLGLNAVTLRRVPGVLVFDEAGRGSASYVNPGAPVGTWAMQIVLFDGRGRLVGSTGAAFL